MLYSFSLDLLLFREILMYLSKNSHIHFLDEEKELSLQRNINHINAMARPIKETPVLTGKDAKRFAEKMENLKPETKEEKEAAKKVYEKFKAIASFTL